MSDPVPVSAISTIGTATVSAIGSNGSGGGKIMSAAELRAAAEAYSSAQVDTLLTGKVNTDDSRLTDSRVPTAHKSTHVTGGADAFSAAEIRGLLGVSTLSGSNTGDQDLSSYLTSSAAASTYLPLAGGTLSGLLQFSGTNHAGLRLINLTAAQRDAIASPQAGMIVWNTTSSRLNRHNGSSWNEGFFQVDGDTFTGPITGTSDIISQRRGLNPQLLHIHSTYTSDSDRSFLEVAAKAATCDFVSRRGSSAGSNLPLRFGHLAANGTTFTGWTLSTASRMTFSSAAGYIDPTSWQIQSTAIVDGGGHARLDPAVGLAVSTLRQIVWSGTSNAFGASVVGVNGRSTGVLEINNGTIGTFRDLECRDVLFNVSSSRTLSVNGQFTIEMTSNTAGNLVYRGSDGTTRRFAMTFV